jgi:hypothetical protein
LLACRDTSYQFSDVVKKSFTVSATVIDTRMQNSWSITGVYNPQEELDKRLFLQELHNLKGFVKSA